MMVNKAYALASVAKYAPLDLEESALVGLLVEHGFADESKLVVPGDVITVQKAVFTHRFGLAPKDD